MMMMMMMMKMMRRMGPMVTMRIGMWKKRVKARIVPHSLKQAS